jgi:hypothetical protein
LHSTLHKPAIAPRIHPHHAGRLVNEIKELAEIIEPLSNVKQPPDPEDDFLLALAQAREADCLVTGDKWFAIAGLTSRHADCLCSRLRQTL